jgi:hypothetical protein
VGTPVTRPDNPELSNHRFLGWFDQEAAGGNEYKAWPYTLNADITMHAQWIRQYTMTFETHGGSDVADITEDTGTPVTEPVTNQDGFRFQGWFPGANSGARYPWPHTLNADITMHAQWKKIHKVIFHPNGGSPAPDPQYIVEGDKADDPGAMIRTVAGLYTGPIDVDSLTVTFDGWHNDPDCEVNLWDFEDPVTGPLDLYAKWTVSSSPIDISGQSGDTVLEKALAYIAGQNLGEETLYTIVLDGDVSMAGVSSANITTANAVITLVGKSPTTISLTGAGALFNISAGELVLDKNITLKGHGSNTASLVRVNTGASLTMNVGATIRDNRSTSRGGGVYVDGGSFTLDGGEIIHNSNSGDGSSYTNGGGVYVNSGSFIMKKGKISNNSASGSYRNNGGGVYLRNGSMLMDGGEISDNSVNGSGGGVVVGQGVTFNMSGGGTISGNSANTQGGGVASDNGSNFTMSGGTISGNSASTQGGGVHIYMGTFSKTGDSFIGGDNDTIAYKDDSSNGNATDNTAKTGNTKGHAVFYDNGSKYRDSDLGSGVNISTSSNDGWNQ